MRKVRLLTVVFAFITSFAFSQTALTVANPSFEIDPVTAGAGYRTSISNWTMTPTGYGLNTGGPFMDNGTVPDGTKVLFIQNVGAATQNVTGFVSGTTYQIRVRVNARAGTPTPPLVQISVNGAVILSSTSVSPVGGTNAFLQLAPTYTATSSGAFDVKIENTNGSADNTLLIDQVEIVSVVTAAKDWNHLQ